MMDVTLGKGNIISFSFKPTSDDDHSDASLDHTPLQHPQRCHT